MMPPRTILRPLSPATASVTSGANPSVLDWSVGVSPHAARMVRGTQMEETLPYHVTRGRKNAGQSHPQVIDTAVFQHFWRLVCSCGSDEELQRCFAVPPGLDHARCDGAVPG